MTRPIEKHVLPSERPGRIIIEGVQPELDNARFAVKRVLGDTVRVEADIFADGHDLLRARLLSRRLTDEAWQESEMRLTVNDRWVGQFTVSDLCAYTYRIEAWPDRFGSWQRDLEKRLQAGQDLESELAVGAAMLRAAAEHAHPHDAALLRRRAAEIESPAPAQEERAGVALDPGLAELMLRYAAREPLSVYDKGQRISVDRPRAVFSSWYEVFPRSTSPVPGEHGSFRTLIERLPYIAGMGFDVVYLPPVHPIGITHRKGKNNSPVASEEDVGSPWAIGSAEGGHDAIHPQLGTLEDFRQLVAAAHGLGMEIALDFAVQCSPDHPYVREHPQWFSQRPDGSIRYAENPPKKYEDIYPLNFETEDWQALWQELERVVRFWVENGVRIFRVDNPHTKQFAFWEWLIARIRADYPDVLFLSEAFTRPKVMYYLAKLGFSQSYTYFTWRNSKWDLTQYLQEITQPPVSEFFRPNLWPNTPDILHEELQTGGRAAFFARYVLAATLSSNYGIYGPAFELCVSQPREPGSEEYLHSEKYELRHWDLEAPHSLRHVISRVNTIRRENTALQRSDNLTFLELANDQLIAYLKQSREGDNFILTVVNLDPHNRQSGWVKVPLYDLGRPLDATYAVHDLLDGATYTWTGEWNYVELDPALMSAHIFRLDLPPTTAGPLP